MEKDANYALVGLFSLALLVGLLAFGIWLAQFNLNRDFQNYDIGFQGPVNGLSKGGEVRFNGIKVGEITQIELDPENTEKVLAHVRMTADVPVRTDSVATIEPLGNTIKSPDPRAGSLRKDPRDRITALGALRPRVRGRVGALRDREGPSGGQRDTYA